MAKTMQGYMVTMISEIATLFNIVSEAYVCVMGTSRGGVVRGRRGGGWLYLGQLSGSESTLLIGLSPTGERRELKGQCRRERRSEQACKGEGGGERESGGDVGVPVLCHSQSFIQTSRLRAAARTFSITLSPDGTA